MYFKYFWINYYYYPFALEFSITPSYCTIPTHAPYSRCLASVCFWSCPGDSVRTIGTGQLDSCGDRMRRQGALRGQVCRYRLEENNSKLKCFYNYKYNRNIWVIIESNLVNYTHNYIGQWQLYIFCYTKILYKSGNARLRTWNIVYLFRNFNKLIIKYQLYPNSTKIDAFKQKICNCHWPYVINMLLLIL